MQKTRMCKSQKNVSKTMGESLSCVGPLHEPLCLIFTLAKHL